MSLVGLIRGRASGFDGGSRLPVDRALYIVVCVAVLAIAAILRFGGLSDEALWDDEVVVADNSLRTISETIDRTRGHNSTPPLYPIVLHFIQRVDISVFSMRIAPAVAGFLTIGVLLFLLPRTGVDRIAALIAGCIATVSTHAVNHARDAREYSIDALVAALMIAGLLAYLTDGRRRLLCVSLIVAPLLQYNLILFGMAIFATALVMRWVSLSKGKTPFRFGGIGMGVRLCRELFLPGLCFLLACAVTAFSTALRHASWFLEVLYLKPYWYTGEYHDFASLFGFIYSASRGLFDYLLPGGMALLAVVLFGLAVGRAIFRGFRMSVIPVLFVFSLAVAILAAVTSFYPFGGLRTSLYLLPVVSLAVGYSVRLLLEDAPALGRKFGVAAIASAILWAGFQDMARRGQFIERAWGDELRWRYMDVGRERVQRRHMERIMMLLEEGKRDSATRVAVADFHWLYWLNLYSAMFDKRDIMIRSSRCPGRSRDMAECLADYSRGFFPGSPWPLRKRVETLLFVDIIPPDIREEYLEGEGDVAKALGALARWRNSTLGGDSWNFEGSDAFSSYDHVLSEYADVSSLDAQLIYPDLNLDMAETKELILSVYRIENFHRFYEPALDRVLQIGESDKILIRSSFDVYLRDRQKIVYVKEPCVEEDTRHPFYLHIFSGDTDHVAGDSPGADIDFESRDFPFSWHGARYEGRCVIEVDLPDYDIARIRAGQYVRLGGDNAIYFDLWRGEATLPDARPKHVSSGDGEPSR